MTNSELKLLIDLCRQIDKHGIDTFISLVEKIKDTDTLSSLELLVPVIKKRQVKPENVSHYDKKSIEIIEKEEVNGNKFHNKLMNVYVYLKDKNSASTVRKIKYFLDTNGKASAGLNGKEKSINYLIRELSKDGNLLNEANSFFNDSDDRTLSAWSDAIMKNKLSSDEK
ncbi:TPA: hypothetical protein ACXR7G_000715 [Yersinia enterocolitica]|nr:hypothetical protein [Yersinia enterocolitica]